MEEVDPTTQEVQQRIPILRHLDSLLSEATVLRIERDKEEKAIRQRSTPIWDAQDALEAKMKELREYLSLGGQPTGWRAREICRSSFVSMLCPGLRLR